MHPDQSGRNQNDKCFVVNIDRNSFCRIGREFLCRLQRLGREWNEWPGRSAVLCDQARLFAAKKSMMLVTFSCAAFRTLSVWTLFPISSTIWSRAV